MVVELLSKVCSVSNIVDYILNDKRYKRLNPYQKENLIIQVFHSKNWNLLKKENRIFLLQEYENIMAMKGNRIPYFFIELRSDYKWDTLLMDMGFSFLTKRLLVRKNFIEDGIKQCACDSEVKKIVSKCLNFELLDGLIHEQYHIITRERKQHHYPIIYREHKEDLVWSIISDMSDRDPKKVGKRYYRYRMVPDEYYAFKYAQNKINRIFSILNRYYGEDENFSKYLKYMSNLESYTVDNYKEVFPYCEDITYDEIYRRVFEEHIQVFSLKEGVSADIVKRDLSLSPSIFDRKE